MKREQIERKKARPRDEAIQDLPQKPGGALAEDLDELLDEIDSVLEHNAEEFVSNYVQQNGE